MTEKLDLQLLTDKKMNRKPGFAWRQLWNDVLPNRVFIAGIINVTPDSFSDGRGFIDTAERIQTALQMLDDGADIIDMGGESTRPGAAEVPAAEEWQRLEPVLKGILSQQPEAVISIDTRHAYTARLALQTGAKIINDVSGLDFDPTMAEVIASFHAGAILTHSTAVPELMQQSGMRIEKDALAVVRKELERIADHARAAGITDEQLMLDVGIGFGKSRQANYQLLHHAQWFESTFQLPFCWGVSRKSLLKSTPDSLEKRIAGSLALAVKLADAKVSLLRVHDVAATVAALTAAAEFDRAL